MPNQTQTHTTDKAVVKLIVGVLQAVGCVAIAAAIVFVGMNAFKEAERYYTLKAMHDCATDYHLEYNDSVKKTLIVRPLDDLYQDCLKQKNIH